jgi:hypothetical protein
MKFERQIPILPGEAALILIVFYVLSLAALQESAQLTADSNNSLMQERLAETITSDILKLDLAAQQVIFQKIAIKNVPSAASNRLKLKGVAGIAGVRQRAGRRLTSWPHSIFGSAITPGRRSTPTSLQVSNNSRA